MPYAAPRIALVQPARPDPRQRLLAFLAAALVVAVVGFALLRGLAPDLITRVSEKVISVGLLPAPPPPPPPPPEQRKPPPERRHEHKPTPSSPKPDAPAPPALRAQATPIVAPKPVVVLPPPTPVVTAPVAGVGAQASQGAAEVAGPGTGAGGQGNGRGGGGNGDGGDGDGDGGSDLRRLSGDVRTSDVPCFKRGECPGGTVYIRFTVGVSGRVTNCTVTRSSGSRELDTETCDAITRRLRYQPATDARGRPIPTEVNGHQRWGVFDRAADDDEPDDDR